ncbi:hypothetical protein [Aeromonas caviae]|uniref:hypothetical protein n=1 Tax=Aeromonas TaxID=642 RepID=UPI00244D7ACC|nr:hypothetical protein [Aeromonas caviae]MDH1993757.1 hypothetical protein [Aeromonas caviae]
MLDRPRLVSSGGAGPHPRDREQLEHQHRELSDTGELTKPKPHAYQHCHAGYITAAALITDAEHGAAQELQYCYSDAARLFDPYQDKGKAA